jgi:hypothetical protein
MKCGPEMKMRLSPKCPVICALACCCLLAGSSFLACMPGKSPHSDLRKTIYLDAKSDWLDTGIFVREGQEVGFECEGTWAVAPGPLSGPCWQGLEGLFFQSVIKKRFSCPQLVGSIWSSMTILFTVTTTEVD